MSAVNQDKAVPGFKQLDRSDVAGMLQKVVRHCGGEPDASLGRPAVRVLCTIAGQVFDLASLRHMSTESLGVIYASAFISGATRRNPIPTCWRSPMTKARRCWSSR